MFATRAYTPCAHDLPPPPHRRPGRRARLLRLAHRGPRADHPERRFVAALCLYSHAVDTGEAGRARYKQTDAERFARTLLILARPSRRSPIDPMQSSRRPLRRHSTMSLSAATTAPRRDHGRRRPGAALRRGAAAPKEPESVQHPTAQPGLVPTGRPRAGQRPPAAGAPSLKKASDSHATFACAAHLCRTHSAMARPSTETGLLVSAGSVGALVP